MSNIHEKIDPLAIILPLFPESIVESLLSDLNFINKYDIHPEVEIVFHTHDVKLQRSKLFEAIREILSESIEQFELTDNKGEKWLLRLMDKDLNKDLILSKDKVELTLPSFYSIMSYDLRMRLDALDQMTAETHFPEEDYIQWHKLLSERHLKDYEVSILQSYINNSPAQVAIKISSQIEHGSLTIEELVPNLKSYYERLVGTYTASKNISEYMCNYASIHIDSLISWKLYDGFLFSLLLSSHSSITSTNIVKQLDTETLKKAFEWLQYNGDIISQLGAIEIGLSILDEKPELEEYIQIMIEQLLEDDIESDQSRFKLLSSLIILVDGEVSHTKVLGRTPPFWRRLASIAHASLIERSLIEMSIDLTKFANWAERARIEEFHIQTFTDLQKEPRWQPGYVSASQLKFEFIGRLVGSAENNKSKIHSVPMQNLLFGEHQKGLKKHIEFPYPFLPGPLEGTLDSQTEAPEETLKQIEEHLDTEILQPSSFLLLVNYATIFKLDSYHAKLATNALRKVKYQLRKVDNCQELFYVLSGLSTVASVTRNKELAQELKILTRRYRQQSGKCQLTVDEALWIGLIAAAAFEELLDWNDFVGDWLTELAFQKLQSAESKQLHSHVLKLCHIVPELWVTCGRAEAALKSLFVK